MEMMYWKVLADGLFDGKEKNRERNTNNLLASLLLRNEHDWTVIGCLLHTLS